MVLTITSASVAPLKHDQLVRAHSTQNCSWLHCKACSNPGQAGHQEPMLEQHDELALNMLMQRRLQRKLPTGQGCYAQPHAWIC